MKPIDDDAVVVWRLGQDTPKTGGGEQVAIGGIVVIAPRSHPSMMVWVHCVRSEWSWMD